MAEGVETETQAVILEGLGYDHYQGYYLSRPLSAAKFVEFIRQFNTAERLLSPARIVANVD